MFWKGIKAVVDWKEVLILIFKGPNGLKKTVPEAYCHFHSSHLKDTATADNKMRIIALEIELPGSRTFSAVPKPAHKHFHLPIQAHVKSSLP